MDASARLIKETWQREAHNAGCTVKQSRGVQEATQVCARAKGEQGKGDGWGGDGVGKITPFPLPSLQVLVAPLEVQGFLTERPASSH